MWNAGVVGLPSEKVSETVDSALALCDGMLNDGAHEFITEQYAYSIALATHTSLMHTDDLIGHYWGNAKDWNQKASEIFLRAYLNDASLEEELEAIDIDELCQIPCHIHRSSTVAKLHRLVDHLFPDSDKHYVNSVKEPN